MLHKAKRNNSVNSLEGFSEFSMPTYEEWRRVTEKSLKGVSFDTLITNTYEGIPLQPMYQSADIRQLIHIDSHPGQIPYLRGCNSVGEKKNSWEISQEIAESTPQQFNKVVREDLSKGQTMVNIVLDEATQNGIDADKANMNMLGYGLSLSIHEDFQVALKEIELSNTPIFIDTGSLSLPVLSHFLAYVKERNIAFERLKGCIGMDPIGTMVEIGSIPYQLETCYNVMGDIVKWANENQTSLQTILVKGQPYHNGGASAVEELAFMLATAVEYIRALQKREIGINEGAVQFQFSFSVGSNVFMEIAKFRAARVLWSTIIDAFGGEPATQKLTIHARTSSWNKTVYDPYVNMLRTTAEAFSAAVGGVDSLHVSPFDEALQSSTPFSRRIARNTQLILQEESHLAKIIDPAGGSWYIEKLTDEVAKKAWELFQQTEEIGGMLQALEKGFPQQTIEKTSKKRQLNIQHCKDVFIGVNQYPNPNEKEIKGTVQVREKNQLDKRVTEVKKYREENKNCSRKLIFHQEKNLLDQAIEEVLLNGRTVGDLADALGLVKEQYHITTIKNERGPAKFELLRKATDNYTAKIGVRPRVFLANIGPLAAYKPRSDFASGFFEAGGFEVLRNNGFESVDDAFNTLLDSKADIVVICMKDENNTELILSLFKQIKTERPSIKVYLTGLPNKEKQAVLCAEGLTDFVHVKSNCYKILSCLLEEMGVI